MKSDRLLATVLFTDIVGSTERAAELGDRRWRELLQAHHALARREIARRGGRELNMTGDGFLATFYFHFGERSCSIGAGATSLS